MSDYKEMRDLGMAPLRHVMLVRLMMLRNWVGNAPRDLAPKIKKSPFYFELGKQLVIASKTETQMQLAQTELALAQRASRELTSHVNQPANAGIRGQFSLPETALGDSYAALRTAKTVGLPKTYMQYRNGIYLRLAAKLNAVMPQLLKELGVVGNVEEHTDWTSTQSADRARQTPIGQELGHLRLFGQDVDKRGILGLELDLPLAAAMNVTVLRFVRDTIWALLDAERAPLHLVDDVRSFYGEQYPLPDMTANADELPLSANTDLLMRATMARGGDVTTYDLAHGSAKLDVKGASSLLAADQLDLNTAAAVAMNNDRFLTLQVLRQAGLPVPLGAVYPTVEVAITDWRAGLSGKALVARTRRRDVSGETEALPMPPEEFQLANCLRTLAGDENNELLVESFKKGDLFRLLVLDGKVLAVLAIDYAYVVGDGRRTVAALVADRNRKRDGNGYPQLQLNGQTDLALKTQGYAADQVLPRGTQAYLGRTSGMLAAGEHRNGRDELDESYDALAVSAVRATRLRLATVDLAVVNSYVVYDAEQGTQASIVNVNGTPDLSEFERPTYGDAQAVGASILSAALRTKSE
ncbi:hypothetical protein PQ472_07355 [Lacticaseibacillus pabuli]|uniref:ATP-grasp domain-containing protein n=1 Tax=Lacticaseibacillus pabuli TaxID=3025672 RepID=A0ABY7WQU1_9LACO|nr:hypothetical protein [Lacticaseibacillus sp. KACC 23028]WDF81743.1 hypothetical protein PQ472_07355 [Lacticaseibacillus sp. KACC 23028]